MLTGHLHYLLCRNVYAYPLPFLKLGCLYWDVQVLYISWSSVSYQIKDLQILSCIPWVVFHLPDGVLWHASFKFWCSLTYFFGSLVLFDIISKKALLKPRSWGLVPIFSTACVDLALYLSIRTTELLFVYCVIKGSKYIPCGNAGDPAPFAEDCFENAHIFTWDFS